MTPGESTEIGRRPQQRRSAAKRQALYEEAVRRFAADGVEATRVEDVVAAAGASWGTFFRYFPRKEDVLLEMTAEHLRRHVRPVVDAALSQQRPARDALLELLLALAPADHPPALHTAALRETFANQQRFAAMLQEGDRPLVMLAYALLAEGQQRGEVRADVDALSLAMTVVAGVLFPLVQTGFGGGPTPEAALRRSFSIVWPGVQASAAAEA